MEYQLSITSATGDDEEAIIPDGVSLIGANVFRGMDKLRRVVLPGSCTTIDDNAFDSCRALEEIVLPDSITSIGSFAFKNCSSLVRIKLPAALEGISKQMFARCTALEAVEGTHRIRTIAADAFSGCSELRSFDARRATLIGERAFSGCRALERVELGNELQKIGHYAFRSCMSLHDITIPDGVVGLETNLFTGCPHITVHASEEMVRKYPDAFPRALTLSYGIIRPQDVRDLSAQFRRNHASDTVEFEQRRSELLAQAEELQTEIAGLGVIDLKRRDAAVAALDDIDAELREIDALLAEIAHPSMQTLLDEFAQE